MSRFITEAARTALCDWLTTHDIDPGTVPENATFDYDARTDTWTTQQYVGNDANGGMATRELRFAGRVPWPLA
jgi:hypothetical protein